MKIFIALMSAILFAAGLAVSGMMDPANIIGFLDIFGDWKPALMLVMVGAIAVHMVSYKFIVNRKSPLLDTKFHIPTKKDIDLKLIIGSALFGIGWGLGGFCPGPAVASLASWESPIFTFVGSMLLGIAIYHYLVKPLISKG